FLSSYTETTSLPIAYSILFFRIRKLESDSSRNNIITATSSDLERGDTIYKIDLIELKDVSSLRKQPEVFYNTRELYKDPLDKGRILLNDKSGLRVGRKGTILANARLRRRYAKHRTIIYIVSYTSVSSSSEARIYLILHAGFPELGANFEGLATETFY
ncbi:hypothetical protein N7530_006027, partial [Penicillium desertorum]